LALYFLHLRDGTDELLAPEGIEYGNMEALRRAVLASVRDLIAGDVHSGVIDMRFRLDAEDEAGEVVYSLPFEHAVSIIPPA
jgi:hypothetical protein